MTQCKAQVRGSGVWPTYHQCQYKSKDDGYCAIHHPKQIKERADTHARKIRIEKYKMMKHLKIFNAELITVLELLLEVFHPTTDREHIILTQVKDVVAMQGQKPYKRRDNQ